MSATTEYEILKELKTLKTLLKDIKSELAVIATGGI